MSATLREQTLGSMRWVVVSGPAGECFELLGAHMRVSIQEAVTDWPLMERLRRHVSGGDGAARLAAVREVTASALPDEWAELAALAAGAGVAVEDLALLNFRGDLGRLEGGLGCSDLAWRRGRSFIAHNEDQGVSMIGHAALLTLAIDGLPRICAFWCPMFLPSNAFTVTGDGLVWSIDSLTVPQPARGAGRHFVARGLQRRCRTVDQAIAYLRAYRCASGFAYTIGDGSGRIAGVETVRGEAHVVEVGAGEPAFWHTNHGRFLPGTAGEPGGDSRTRGDVLSRAPRPDGEPDAAWFLRLLAGAPLPDGVRVDPETKEWGLTMCTFVADLTGGEAVLLARGDTPTGIPLRSLSDGVTDGSRALTDLAFQPR
jgi:Acyl-coenzyme A:6-aminopenicillanic acid acyl-transferase